MHYTSAIILLKIPKMCEHGHIYLLQPEITFLNRDVLYIGDNR